MCIFKCFKKRYCKDCGLYLNKIDDAISKITTNEKYKLFEVKIYELKSQIEVQKLNSLAVGLKTYNLIDKNINNVFEELLNALQGDRLVIAGLNLIKLTFFIRCRRDGECFESEDIEIFDKLACIYTSLKEGLIKKQTNLDKMDKILNESIHLKNGSKEHAKAEFEYNACNEIVAKTEKVINLYKSSHLNLKDEIFIKYNVNLEDLTYSDSISEIDAKYIKLIKNLLNKF